MSHIVFSQVEEEVEVSTIQTIDEDYYEIDIVRLDSKFGIKKQNNVLYSQLDTAYFEKEMDVYLIKQNEKWGAISKTGFEILSCNYDKVTYFSDMYMKVCNNKKWGVAYKSPTNIIVVPIEYDSIYYNKNYNYYIVVEKDGLLGLYYEKSKKLLDCKYSSIKPIIPNILVELKENNKVKYYMNGTIINDSIDFSQSFLITNSSNQYIKPYFVNITVFGKGVINKNGVQIIPAKYNQIVYKEKIQISPKDIRINDMYIFVESQNSWGAYNIQTKETTPCTYASIEKLAVALNLPEVK